MTCPVELTDRAVRDLDALYPEKRGRIRDRELYSYLKLFWARDGNVSFVSRRHVSRMRSATADECPVAEGCAPRSPQRTWDEKEGATRISCARHHPCSRVRLSLRKAA